MKVNDSKQKKNYIDNEKFCNELINYRERCDIAKAEGKEDPPIPNYIGECFMKIAENFSHNPQFINYTFRDEMIADSIENCLMYFRNFDPNKSKNPFAYFTQIIYYAFLRRIQKEKKELYIKYKSTENVGILDEYELLEGEDGINRQFELYDNISDFIEKFETGKRKKLEEKKKKNQYKTEELKVGIENFVN